MKPSRDELERWDRQVVWHAFTQMSEYEPLIIDRAEGCTLYDLDGRAYLDATSSLWCNLHGHRHPRIDAAVREQLDRVAHTTNLGASNPATIELAKRLVDLAPPGLEHVFFSDDGATAVEAALKMAFQYWRQRPDPRPEKACFVALADAYHGDTLGSVSVGGVARFHAMFEPLLFEVLRLPVPRDERNGEAVARHLAVAEALLAAEHRRIAALVIEPLMQCAAGMVTHSPGYLRGIRELTRRYDVLLVADEVAVGLGRTGRMFACQHEDVSPDFLCLAKGLSGGYMPLAATLATDEVWQAFLAPAAAGRQFFHGHTFGGNPLGAAAGLASLDVFEQDQVLARLPEKIERLTQQLARLARHSQVADVRQRGLMAGVELKQPAADICRRARERGVLLRPLGHVVPIIPPLAIGLEEIDRIVAALEFGIDESGKPKAESG